MKLKNKLFALFALLFVLQSAQGGYYGRDYRYGRPGVIRGGVVRPGVYAGPAVYAAPAPVYVNAGDLYDDGYYNNGVGVGAGVDGIVGAEVGVGNGVGADVNIGGLNVGAGIGFW